jgi:tRNA pseudouridine38-40 synthase
LDLEDKSFYVSRETMLKNIALKISYIGKNYAGWQIQRDVPTVQGEIKKAIKKITGEDKIKVIGASRTDAGVHALCQIANFITSSEIPPERFKYALNTVLPDDIRILKSCEVDMSFNARYTPCEKTYKYIIYQGEIIPFLKDFVLSIKSELNIEKMQRCAEMLVGEKDFAGFTPEKTNTQRTIFKSQITKKGKFIIYEIKGRSFLRYMVRNIVGTLILVGLEKLKEEDFEKILKGEEKARFTAPPHALYLADIKYLGYDI